MVNGQWYNMKRGNVKRKTGTVQPALGQRPNMLVANRETGNGETSNIEQER